MKRQTSLERKMLSYFGLIAAASLLITVEFVYAIQSVTPSPEMSSGTLAISVDNVKALLEAMESLRNKALLMCAVQAVVTLIVLIMFMRRITGPLQHMVESSKIISDGDLSRTIQVRGGDEIGLLGETINGLTSNVQEIVAYGRSTISAARSDMEALRSNLAPRPEILSRLDDLEAKLVGFEEMMGDIKLLTPSSISVEGRE
jgi:methyl-accepting chemotaxis protein